MKSSGDLLMVSGDDDDKGYEGSRTLRLWDHEKI